jgi:hypothetical protein
LIDWAAALGDDAHHFLERQSYDRRRVAFRVAKIGEVYHVPLAAYAVIEV